MPIRNLAIWTLTLSAVASAAGIAVDPESFALNLLAEIAGITLGVSLAILLVDKISESSRRHRWLTVRTKVVDSLHDRLEHIIFQIRVNILHNFKEYDTEDETYPAVNTLAFYYSLADEIRSNVDKLAKQGTLDVRIIRDANRNIPHWTELSLPGAPTDASNEEASSARYDRSLDERSTKILFNEVELTISQLQSTVIDRILTLGEEPELAAHVLDLEALFEKWREIIYLIDGWGMPETFAWNNLADIVRQIARTVQYISETSPEGQ